MLQPGEQAPLFSLPVLDGAEHRFSPLPDGNPALLVFLETDCPTCRLTVPYLNRLAGQFGSEVDLLGISQDNAVATREFASQMQVRFPVLLDEGLQVTRQYDPVAVPTLFLVDRTGSVSRTMIAFDKAELNAITADLCAQLKRAPFVLAEAYDGMPSTKPGCTSRHLEPATDGELSVSANPYATQGARAEHIELADDADVSEYCMQARFDSLPVVPPNSERVERMMRAVTFAPEEIIALVPPNYGPATIEKIAANAVMAGCQPEMMRVLIPLVRAACDERFNLHGVQATTHFAAPLVIVNGPVRQELGFACRSNVFSNVARAKRLNSSRT